jgi:hypothetical protein
MPNQVISTVIIEPQGAKESIFEKISQDESVHGVFKTFYPDQIIPQSESDLSEWCFQNVGTTDLSLSLKDGDLKITTSGWLPDGFLVKLFFSVCDQFDDVKIQCKWHDDTETQIGVAVVYNGFYAEEDSMQGSSNLEDPFYVVTGSEIIFDIQSWLLLYADKYGDITKYEVQIMEDDKIRNMFSDTKSKLRRQQIELIWEETQEYCIDAIYLEDFDYVTKLVKIANRKYESISGCYPFN